MFSEDLSVFFNDFAVNATFGAETQKVLADLPDEIFSGDQIVSGKYKITYQTGFFNGLKHGSAITVDSVNYTVNEVTAIDDGALTEAYLSKV